MVNTQYRVDHRASKRYNLIASNSLLPTGSTSAPRNQPATHRRYDYHRQNAITAIGDATTATSNASPPRPPPATPRSLSVRHRRHRFRQCHDRCRQCHDRYRQHAAAIAYGNATTATGNPSASLLQSLPATHLQSLKPGIASAPYVLSVSSLFLCGPLRCISVNARLYVQCCLVL